MVWANNPRIGIEQCHHSSVTPRRLERRKHHAVRRRDAMWYPVHWRDLPIPARDHRVGLGFLHKRGRRAPYPTNWIANSSLHHIVKPPALV